MANGDKKGMPIANILVRNRRRPISEAKVAALMVSMAENDFIGAIELRITTVEAEEGLYDLVAGAHRLAAWSRLGNSHIPFVLKNLTDDEAAQIEVDENLLAPDLTPLERAEFLLARHEIWSRRFPERAVHSSSTPAAKRGRPKKSEKISEFLGGGPTTMGFAADTAAEIGVTDRTIRHSLEIVRGIPAELRERIHGTSIAKNSGALRELAALGDRDEQAKVAEILIGGATKSVSDARALAAGNTPVKGAQTPVDETLKAFRRVWGAASPSARAAILHDLAGRTLPKGWSVTEPDRG